MPKHLMNDRTIHRKSEDFHNRFSCIIASNSSDKTTTRGQGHISSFTPPCRINQHINQCFLPMNEPHHVRITRADPQFSIFPSRNFSKSGIHLFSPRQTMNRLNSASEHFVRHRSPEKYENILARTSLNRKISFQPRRNCIQRGPCLSSTRISSPSKTTIESFVSRTNHNFLPNGMSIYNNYFNEGTGLCWNKQLVKRQTRDQQYEIVYPFECPHGITKGSTSEKIRKLHDSFHKNSKRHVQSGKPADYLFGTVSPNVGEINVEETPKFKTNEETRICSILREALGDCITIPRGGRMGSQSNCSYYGDQIILKPLLRFESNESNRKSTNSKGGPIKGNNEVPHVGMSTMTLSNISVENETCEKQILGQLSNDFVDVVNDNDNNNNLALETEGFLHKVKDSSDDESLDMSDEGIQALLMPIVLNFLSDQ